MQTLLWYFISAFLFGEVYIWSASTDAKLGHVDVGRPYERQRINERPIFVRTLFFYLSVVQSVLHLYHDYDKISLRPHAPRSSSEPLAWIKKQGLTIAHTSVLRVAFTTATGAILYLVILRHISWSIALRILPTFFTVPKNQQPPYLFGLVDILARFLLQGLLLEILWEFSNAMFTDHVTEEPLKRGQPLTSDSRDPNGSLLHGLKTKKKIPKAFAFWELDIIATQFEDRRRALFMDVDRMTGPAWKQIKDVCLTELQKIDKRIQQYFNPNPPAPEQVLETQKLPSILDPPKPGQEVFEKSAPQGLIANTANGVSDFARSHGQTPGAQNPISPQAQKLLKYTADKTMSAKTQEELSPAGISGRAKDWTLRFLRTPAGKPFRFSFSRRATAVVLGAPTSNEDNILHAANALSTLVVRSLLEDDYGVVAKDLPEIVRTFVATIKSIKNLLQTMKVHWTDVGFKEEQRGEIKEVENVMTGLKEGLEKILMAEGEYLEGLGLNRKEINEAKELTGKGKKENKEEVEMKEKARSK
ncbi:MAG: hypothetical protein M1820_009778 [Bogoriella megaspora]|nr:MAG: hypothetical protein M1820_009778 [Bogoriella megaspora]